MATCDFLCWTVQTYSKINFLGQPIRTVSVQFSRPGISIKRKSESFIKNSLRFEYVCAFTFCWHIDPRSQLNEKNYCINKWNGGQGKKKKSRPKMKGIHRDRTGKKSMLTDFHWDEEKKLWIKQKQTHGRTICKMNSQSVCILLEYVAVHETWAAAYTKNSRASIIFEAEKKIILSE